MADSKVMAVSIGFAFAGIAALGALAGYTIEDGGATAALAPDVSRPAAQLLPSELAAPQSPAVGQAGATTVDREKSPTRSRSAGSSTLEPGEPARPEPLPTPRETFLPPPRPAEPQLTSPAEAEIDRSGTFEPVPIAGDIYSVDFYNSFTYPLAGIGPLEVTRGHQEIDPAGQTVNFTIDNVVYGDVTGDGNDDAIVVFHFFDQWEDTISLARVFSVSDGLLFDMGSTWADYQSRGGINRVDIPSSGTIRIESTNDDQSRLFETVWAIQGANIGLQRVETTGDKVFLDLALSDSNDPVEVAADWLGATRAVISSPGSGDSLVAFTAEAGWMVDVSGRSGATPQMRVWSQSTGQLIGDASQESPVQLPGADRYVGQVLGTSPVVFDLEVIDQRTMQAPTWMPRSMVEIVEEPARRQVSLSWPEFTTASGAANLDAVNATIEDFVNDRLRRHQAQVAAECEVDERSMFSLDYRLTLVSYDLVSIDFSEFICLCERGDSWERHALTIDMNTGRRIDVERTALTQSIAFEQLWWSQTVEQNYFDTSLLHEVEHFVEIETVSLTPDGIIITAESDEPDSLVTYARTHLSFDELGDLIDPAIALRARSGAAVPIPIEEGCGC